MTPLVSRAPSVEAVGELLTALGEVVSASSEVLEALSGDSSRAVPQGFPAVTVRATQTVHVQRALEWATRWRVPVSVRGAGTGLAGGAIAYPDGLVISTAGMDRILAIDPSTG